MNLVVKEYVEQELLNGKSVADNDELLLNGLIDSIGVMRLVTFIEQKCGISIPPEDVTIDHFANLLAIDAYIQDRASS